MEGEQGGSAYEIGMAGEEYAVAYLKAGGYEVLCRNYRHRRAEIDILALKGGFLVVVEVKTRCGGFYEALSDSISRKKIALLVRAADHFVRQRGLEVEVRFDIIQITGPPSDFRLTHWPGAFYFF